MGLIKKPSEIEAKKNISMMIYGQPGMGKTTLALSAPGAVLFDYDGGVNRINAAHQVPTLQVTCWEETVEAIQEVVADPSYNTIVIDTLGKMVGYIEKWIQTNDTTQNKGKRVWTYPNGSLTLKGFGERKNQFKMFLNSVLTANRSVVFVAHEKEDKRDDKVVKRADAGSDGFAADIFKDLDLVGYIYGIGNERHITFQTNDEHFCKKTGSMANDYVIPVTVNEKGDAIKANDFIAATIIPTYTADQNRSRDMHKKYDELVSDIETAIDSISDAEGANKFCEWIKSTTHIYDSRVIALTKFKARVAEIGLTFNKQSGKYEQAA